MTEHSSFAQENYKYVPHCSQYLFLVYRVWRNKVSHQKAMTGVGSRGNLRVSRNTLFRPWWGLINFSPEAKTHLFHTSLSTMMDDTQQHILLLELFYSLCLSFIWYCFICDNSYDIYTYTTDMFKRNKMWLWYPGNLETRWK